MIPILSLLLALAAALPAGAQEPSRPPLGDSVAALDLPESVAWAVVDFFNDPRRERFRGPTRVEAGEVVRGDVAVLLGPYEVLGRVEGSVVVVNGDVRLRRGAEITGDLLVVGGVVAGVDSARVGGEILAYTRRLDFREEGSRIVRIPPPPRPAERADTATGEAWGRGDFLVSTGRSYNRVEGLPVTFGPRIETAGRNPLRVHALGIYRSTAGLSLDPERMGYYVRAEQFLGGRRALRVGVEAHSLVDPIEEWHLSDLENGLATFVLHRDFRDYYEREGVGALVTWEPRAAPIQTTLELRSENHRTLPVRSPWTLFDNGDGWRMQPLIAGGRILSLALGTEVDTRSHEGDPATGWLLRGRVERSLDSDLERLLPLGAGGAFVPVADGFDAWTAGLLDLRRYNRVDPTSRLNFRLVAGGSVDGGVLPPQRQHALGGEGSLPGFGLFEMDCGARDRPFQRGEQEFFPAYGCDQFALLQTEFRGKLDFRLRFDATPWEDEDDGWGIGWDAAPDWTVFVDAARAWSRDDRMPDEGLRVDAGFGLLVERFGIFVARPISGDGGGVNLFVRLGPRF